MATLTITSVLDEIEEWQSKYGDFMYSVTAFAGYELVRGNYKSKDKAILMQGLLKESLNQPLEMTVEHAGTSKNGHAKWKLLGISEGAQPSGSLPDVPRVTPAEKAEAIGVAAALRPEFRSPADFRAEKAIDAAVALAGSRVSGLNTYQDVLAYADAFLEWLTSQAELESLVGKASGGEDGLASGKGDNPTSPPAS